MSNYRSYTSPNYGALPDPSKHYDVIPGGLPRSQHVPHVYDRVPPSKPESPYGVMPSVTSHLPVHLRVAPIAKAAGVGYRVPDISFLKENPYGVAIPISTFMPQQRVPVKIKVPREMRPGPSLPNPNQQTSFRTKSAVAENKVAENIYGVAIPPKQPMTNADVKPKIPKRVLSPEEMQHRHINTVKENLQQFHDGLKKEKGTAAMMPALRAQLKEILNDVSRLRGVLNQEKFASAKTSIGKTLASTHAKMREMEKHFSTPKKEVEPQPVQSRTRLSR